MTRPTGAAVAVLEVAECAVWHESHSSVSDAPGRGADWRCKRCGPEWTASRLDAVRGYAAFMGSRA